MTVTPERAPPERAPPERTQAGAGACAGRIGVIDIGSNSIRLVVYDGLKRAALPVFNEKVLCGLGRGLARTNRLNADGVALALANLLRFRQLTEGMRVERTDLLATAAVRDADDGAEFIARIESDTGLKVHVISGEEEARLSALGVLSGTPAAHGLVGDLGGGSLELVNLEHGEIRQQITLPLGPLRLMEQGTPRQGAIQRIIDQHLETVDWLAGAAGRDFYPVGGSWRALAKLHMEKAAHPLHIIHHYAAGADDAREFAGVIARLSRSSLERVSSVSRRRIDTLPYAALVMERLLRAAAPSRVVFSAYGLREGRLYSLLSPEEQRCDPLIAACADLALRLGRASAAEILASWTDGLVAGEDEAGRRLREAACHVADIAWAEHPDYRAEHAYLRLLRYPFPGIDHDERAFLALVGHARHAGNVDSGVTATARALLTENQVRKALVLGLALRLAHTLTGGAAPLLRRTSLRLAGDELQLALPEDASVLAGEVVERRLGALASALNREARIVAPAPRAATE